VSLDAAAVAGGDVKTERNPPIGRLDIHIRSVFSLTDRQYL